MSAKTIRINGVEKEFIADGIVLEDFLNNLNSTLMDQELVISSLMIDGHEVSEGEETAIRKKNLNEIGNIEIFTANPADLAYETISTLVHYVDRLTVTIQRAAMHYRGKTHVSGDVYFAKAIDGLDLFVQTIGGVKLALKIGMNPKVALTEASLVSIMNDLLEAKRANNYVFLAELLDQDLIENLSEWKDQIFPLMQNFRNS